MSAAVSDEAVRLAERWRLAVGRTPRGGLAGARLGRGTGASLEFEDRRSYVAGDDVRHLDWRAYARTGELLVKLHREEIAPRVEIVLDASRSMSPADERAKPALARDLAGFLAHCARGDGFQPTLVTVGERAEVLPLERFEREGLAFDARATLPALLPEIAALLRPGALRVVISDFLYAHDAAALLRPLAARAGTLVALQVLSAEDAAPAVHGAFRLTDAESGESVEHVVDARAADRYGQRLQRLTAGLEEEARRSGGRFLRLVADRSLSDLCRDTLAPAGLIVPA